MTGAKCTYDLGTRTSYRKTPACFFSQDLLTLYTSLFRLFSRVFFLNSKNVHSEYNILKCGISEGHRGGAFAPSGHDTGAESVSLGWQGRCPGWWDGPQASLAQMEFYRCVLEDSPGTLYVHVLGICFSSCVSPLLPLKCNFFLFRSGEASPSGHGCP